MFLTKSLKSVAQHIRCNNNIINKHVPCSLRTNQFQRQYCNEKFKIVDETTSLLTIRKTLKIAGVESTDGYSFIKTICPVCDFADGKFASSIYINKVSGKWKFRIWFSLYNFFDFGNYHRQRCMSILSTSYWMEFRWKILPENSEIDKRTREIERIVC